MLTIAAGQNRRGRLCTREKCSGGRTRFVLISTRGCLDRIVGLFPCNQLILHSLQYRIHSVESVTFLLTMWRSSGGNLFKSTGDSRAPCDSKRLQTPYVESTSSCSWCKTLTFCSDVTASMLAMCLEMINYLSPNRLCRTSMASR